ncbi:MAG: hypothetical protein ACJAQW_000758 [Paracoccaceae bacterium]|jgi:hypothetical protein
MAAARGGAPRTEQSADRIRLTDFLGHLACEATVIGQDLAAFQHSLVPMLAASKLTHEQMSDIQSMDELTQRQADIATLLTAVLAHLSHDDTVDAGPLISQAKLARTRRLFGAGPSKAEVARFEGETGAGEYEAAVTWL